jgi:hypothetical protein
MNDIGFANVASVQKHQVERQPPGLHRPQGTQAVFACVPGELSHQDDDDASTASRPTTDQEEKT